MYNGIQNLNGVFHTPFLTPSSNALFEIKSIGVVTDDKRHVSRVYSMLIPIPSTSSSKESFEWKHINSRLTHKCGDCVNFSKWGPNLEIFVSSVKCKKLNTCKNISSGI